MCEVTSLIRLGTHGQLRGLRWASAVWRVFLSFLFLVSCEYLVIISRMQSDSRLTKMRDCSSASCFLICLSFVYMRNADPHLDLLDVPSSNTTLFWNSKVFELESSEKSHLTLHFSQIVTLPITPHWLSGDLAMDFDTYFNNLGIWAWKSTITLQQRKYLTAYNHSQYCSRFVKHPVYTHIYFFYICLSLSVDLSRLNANERPE